MSFLRALLWLLALFLLGLDLVMGIGAQAAQGGAPACSLSAGAGVITDHLTELHPITGDFKWYVVTLDGPGGQQIDYFKPAGTTWTVSFPSQGPGPYRGGLLTTVDNQKGPAKFTTLATACTVSL